ncbi:hypothetical protein [Nakamurella deserti]|uniref:hypothetical protein n=1 Tax=Nakamurella deserti TaxID=2164074 RepID=UPI000DBE8E00|nr:hypothetical protein [Nakamurella deserti]
MTDTTPLSVPAVRRPSRAGRFVVATGDLLAAGMLVLGLGLALAMIVLPAPGSGPHEGTGGPGWGPVAAHLAVGVLAEAGGQLARRRGRPVRIAVAVVTVVAASVVLARCWWR